MSTLSGIVSKGEKGKTKYQSIDINSLYRSSRGESLEQHQQKNTVPRKHGMQSLGKVPSARRPPANLPSLRSETSSSDPAVSLVPSGGSGWATTKESTPTTSTVTTTTPSDNTTTNSAPAQCTTGPTPASLTPQQHPPLPGQQSSLQTPHPSEAGNKSSWSAIMSRSGDAGGGPPNQQQQTQPNREMNAQYGPGPSLRPQTEGSWIQGGSRITGGQNTGVVAGVAGSGNIQVGPGPQFGPGQPEPLAGGRPNLVQSPGMATVPVGQGPQNNQAQISAGQVGPNMHHYRGIIPPFMYKGNFPSGNFPAQFPAGGPRPRFNYPAERSPTQQQQQQQQPPQQRGDRGGAQPPAEEEIQTRPIIKEEDLSRMDDISRDAGWTASDDIDYNQKLAFSDDEADNDPSSSSGTTINKKDDNRKEQEKLAQEEKHALEEKEQLNAREKEREQKESSVVSGVRNEPPPRNDMQSLRSWNNQGPVPRSDFRGPPGPPPTNYAPQQSMRPNTYSLRAGGDEDEVINQRRREQVSEKVASTIERARQRKEEEEKRFQELTKQAAAKKLQDLENKLKEKHKQKDEEHHQGGQTNDNSNKPGPGSSAPASIIPLPDWERDREGRSRTSSTEGATKDADGKQSSTGQQSTSEFRQIDRPSFMRQQQQSAGEQSSTSGLTPGGVGSGSNRGERERERDRDRDQQGMREPAFSRHFQSNLPPRFQKQQAERSGAGTAGAPNNRLSPSAERSQPVSFSQQYDPSRWVHNHSNSLSSSMKSGHPLSAPSRRTRADSDVSGPLDDDSSGSSRPGSRVPPPMRSEDRDRERDRDRDRDRERDRDRPRHPNHRSVGGNYDHPRKEDSRYYDDYPRRGDRYKDDRYDYDDRHGRDSGSWADQREHSERRVYDDKPEGRDARDSRDSRDLRDRDLREKKDYDNYSKGPASQDSYDDQQPSSQLQHSRDGPVSRSESSVPEWRDDRRDIRSHDDRSSNDGGRRSGDLPRSTDEIQPQRNERPQRPDSRDSRASRESRTSLRGVDDDNFHKSSRDSGSSSWAACNDFSDYEDSKKQQRDIFREDIRDRDRDRERDRDRDRERDRDRDREGPSHPRDRRQPPGPVTKDKLDQEEVKRGLTQLKRGGPDAQDKKDNQSKIVEQSSNDSKKDSTNEPWNRNKPERTPENNNRSASDSIPKSSAWADAVSPTFEKEEEKRLMDSQHSNEDDKKMIELKQSIEKLSLDSNKRDHETSHSNDTDKDDQKDDKREKNARNRASSSGSRGSRGGEPRSARQWGSGGSGGGGNERAGGAFNVYAQRWRGSEAPARGRRPGGGPRSMGVRSGSAKGQGNYERTDSELSGDEPITGPPTESVKDERRSSSARSPKPSAPKGEKEERNRSAASTRKEDQQSQPLQQQQQGSRGGDFNQSSRNEKRSERNDYNEVRGGGRPSREGFAPSGEPSRRGRGGFRNNRGAAPPAGSAASGRMEGYGPPPSKSPFSSERAEDNKHSGNQQHSSTPTPSEHEDNGNATNQSESTDDKIIAKQQALNAGITGRHAKSPNQMNINHNNANSRGSKKEDARSKRTRSGSRRGRGGGAERNRASNNLVNNKQNNADPGNEDWETTSENSEEHTDERKDGHGGRPNKQYGGRSERQNSNIVNSNAQHPREPRGNRDREPRGEKGPKSSNPQSNRTSEKGRNAQNASERGGNRDGSQRSHHSGNIPSLMQNSQTQNGRPRSQGSANSGPISNKSMMNKDATVNRIDEIKLNDPNLVNQALNDINASKSKDKRGTNVDDIDSNCIGDDIGNTVDDKIDADGFQEVRSKKNVKDSSRQQQKDDQQSSKPGRRDRDKDRGGERDRSKSKTNGPQSQQGQQQGQNMSPLLGQAIGQAGPGAPSKQYDRNPRSQKLAPRFQKQRLAKQQQQQVGAPNESNDSTTSKPQNQQANTIKDTPGGVAPPPTTNAWDKPFTGGATNRSPPSPAIAAVPANIQLMSGLTPGGQTVEHEASQGESQQPTGTSTGSSQRNSPNIDKVATGKLAQVKESSGGQDKNATDTPVQTLIFENTNYSKNTKNSVGSAGDMAIKSKYSSNMKAQSRDKRSNDLEDDTQLQQQHQQQALSVAFSSKPNDLVKDKLPQQQQEPIQMPLSFNNKEDNADMKLDFTFDSDLSQLTEDKTKSLAMPRSMHMTGGQSTISPSTAELNLKIASVKKVWENAPPMPTVVEHEVDGNVVSTANSFPQAFESNDVDDGYSTHQQYNQSNMKNEITTSTNVCKLVPPQVKPQQQSSGGGGAQPGSSVPGPSPIGPGQSPIGHPPASLQGPLSPPPFNSTGQPSHINYQEFAQYPGSQAAQYGSMPAIPSPPAVLFNTGSGQLPAQAGGLYGAFQLDQSRSPFTQYPPYAASLQNSFNQQNMYLQQPPPPHAPNAPTPDIYQSNLSQYRLTAAAAPPFGQNQQLSNNPNTVLISSSSNSLMSATVKPSSQPIGAIGTKAPHFQAPSAPPQPNQLAYIPYDPNQVLGVSGSYMGNSQLVQRPGPNVQPSANNYYSATSADVFSGSQTGFYQPGGTAQQTGAHYSLQGFGQHSQSLATGNAAPVGLQNFSSQFLSGSGLQIAAAAAQQYRNPTSGLPGPANAAATFLSKHQQQEQPRQLKSPSGNQQDVLSVFSSTSPKSRKQQSSSQQPQPSPTQHHKFPQYQNVNQSALQQNVRGMGMPPRGGIQPSQQRYPPPIQRPVVPFPGPNNSQQGQQQQQTCIPNQQQSQMNRHRPNIHQQQQQQRNMKMQQQYYSGQSNVKMDSNDKVDSHNDKISDNNAGNQSSGNKSNANPSEGDNKEEVNQQNE